MTSNIPLTASEHPIRSVTVFKSAKAEVVRTFSLNLEKGQNKIEIEGLPSTIDTHSVRVSGLGSAARLLDVVCSVELSNVTFGAASHIGLTAAGSAPAFGASTAPAFPPVTDAIRALRAKKATLESEKRVREHEADLLVNYGKTLSGEHVSPVQMTEFLQNFVERGKRNLDAVAILEEKIVEIDRQIDGEINKKVANKGSALGSVTIVVFATESCPISLKLTYIVSNVFWKPTYELHATTGENSKPSSTVSLQYRARVMQTTGEDWNGTSLTLSTVESDMLVKTIPRLAPLKIKPQENRFGRFKNNANVTTQPGLFGSNPQKPTGSGLFGVLPAANAAGGSLFGAQPAVQHQQHAPFQQQAQSQQQAPSSLFGSALSQTAGASALLGSASSQTAGTSALFGSALSQIAGTSTSTADTTTHPTFGQSHAPSRGFGTASFGGGLFGGGSETALPAPSFPEAEEISDEQNQDFEEIPLPSALEEARTVVTETPIAISYSVYGESTIPSDGMDHQVSVAILPFDAKISYVTVPRADPRVYLQCEVKNSSEYRLLPGPVSVIMDDSYVSKTSIHDINTGDYFTCTLGDDPSTKVTYSRSVKTVKENTGTFAETIHLTMYNTKISIYNRHIFALPTLVIKDALPTAEDSRAKVLLKSPKGLAEAKDGQLVDVDKNLGLQVGWGKIIDGKGGEKDGRFEWKCRTVGPGAKLVLEAEWVVKAAADVNWVETPVFFEG